MDQQTIKNLKLRMEYENNRTAPPEGFPQFPDIPAERYVSESFYDLELEHMWRKSWLYAGHVDEVPEVGSFKVFDKVPDMPVFLVRGRDHQVRAFYNTCSHRGACVVREKQGKCSRLMCGFHAWTYDLQGNLVGVTDQRDFIGLDKSQRGLMPLRCEQFGNWLFINGDMDAKPLAEQMNVVGDELQEFELDKLKFMASYSYEVPANWKVVIDAFLENYHFQSVHAATVGAPGPNSTVNHFGSVMRVFPFGNSSGILPWNVGFKRGVNEDLDMGFDAIPDIPSTGDIARETVLAYNIFPNLFSPTFSNGLPFNVLWPTSRTTTLYEVHWFGLDPGDDETLKKAWGEKIAAYNLFLDEDLAFVPSVQRSMQSPAFRSMPLNYQEKRIYNLHEELDRVIGCDKIPEAMRVVPVLENFIERSEDKAAIPEIA